MAHSKQDIDALVDAMPKGGCNAVVLTSGGPDQSLMAIKDMRRLLYLAAGLTAEGERKPERVRCWMVRDAGSPVFPADSGGHPLWPVESFGIAIPGWFVPDCAE